MLKPCQKTHSETTKQNFGQKTNAFPHKCRRNNKYRETYERQAAAADFTLGWPIYASVWII